MSYTAQIDALTAEREKYVAKCYKLLRWKSTHAPRIEAMEGLLKHAQLEAHAGREAIATLASEREANAILTAEVEQLRKNSERYRWLRENLTGDNWQLVFDETGSNLLEGETLDRAVDAAIARMTPTNTSNRPGKDTP